MRKPASGYVDYLAEQRPITGSRPNRRCCFADEDRPGIHRGADFETALAGGGPHRRQAHRRVSKSGAGIGWHEHDHALFHGIARFLSRRGTWGNLVDQWIPALDGVRGTARNRHPASRTSVCGHGISTILMAQAFSAIRTSWAFDYHAESIEAARKRAGDAGVADRCRFEVGRREGPSGNRSTTSSPCSMRLHDMGDPAGAARHILAPARVGRGRG